MSKAAQAKYLCLDDIQAAIQKSWIAGAKQPSEQYEFLLTADFLSKTAPQTSPGDPAEIGQPLSSIAAVTFSPALSKIIDEIVVNALDQVVRCAKDAHRVKAVHVKFDEEARRITVTNDGPGIEVYIHEEGSRLFGKPTWIPTMVFGHFNQGSNHHENPATIIGGTNGLGAKAANCHSVEFTVSTSDASARKSFSQTWLGMHAPGEPTIKDWPASYKQARAQTSISFVPNYALFAEPDTKQEVDSGLLRDVIRTRAYFAAAYAGFTQPDCKVYFDDVLIPVKNLKDLSEVLFPQGLKLHTRIKPSEEYQHQVHPWEVTCIVTPLAKTNFAACTMVNGIIVRGGAHISHIMSLIRTGLADWYAANYKNMKIPGFAGRVDRCVFLMANTKIPAPQWEGQRKENMSVPRKFPKYALPAGFIDQLAVAAKPYILEGLKGYKPPKKKLDLAKYSAASLAGGPKSHLCSLILVEGDSVKNHILGPVSEHLGTEFYGIMDTGGVPMNSRKHATVETVGGTRMICPDEKFEQNKFLSTLYWIVGLDYNCTYAEDSDMLKLKYGRGLVACVDQDEDGKGNILALIAGYVEHFWPNLVRRGFIRWIQTPIIRVYPRTASSGLSIQEFYTTEAYEEWAAGSPGDIHGPYREPKYYKGVGTHSKREIHNVFAHFDSKIITLFYDSDAARKFNIFLGPDPDTRKVELAAPIIRLTPQELLHIEERQLLSISRYLDTDVKSYQLDNLDRKLPNVADGLNQVSRKILYGLLKYYSKPRPEQRVATLAGHIVTMTAYQHGETSLNDAIRGKGFIGCGGKQLPMLTVYSNFGTRIEGGADAAAPRYIYCKLNTRLCSLLYPDIDYADLPAAYEEGMRIEPEYFAPIVPTIVLESIKIPSHGWKNETWAMSVQSALRATRCLIYGVEPLPELHVCTYAGTPYAWTGRLAIVDGKPCSMGRYEIDRAANQITIVELPLRKWTGKYFRKLLATLRPETLKGAAPVAEPENIRNESTDHRIRIIVRLNPGAMAYLEALEVPCPQTDPIIEYFKLRSVMSHELNCMSPMRDKSMHYGVDYTSMVRDWFAVRKHHYALRVVRQRLLLELRALKIEQIITYIGYCVTSTMAKLSRAKMVERLAELGYVRISTSALEKHKQYPTSRLREAVLSGDAASYGYLLSMGDQDKSSEQLDKHTADLAKLRRELAELRQDERFPGASQWLSELKQLEELVEVESARGWEPPGSEDFQFPDEPSTSGKKAKIVKVQPARRGRAKK